MKGEVMRLTRDFWKSVTLDDNEGHCSGFKDPVVVLVPSKHGQGQRVSQQGSPLPQPIQYFLFAALGSLLLTVLLYWTHSIPQSAYKSDLIIYPNKYRNFTRIFKYRQI